MQIVCKTKNCTRAFLERSLEVDDKLIYKLRIIDLITKEFKNPEQSTIFIDCSDKIRNNLPDVFSTRLVISLTTLQNNSLTK
jgi:hypothetical protein